MMHKIRLIDFLFPQKLLKRTDAEDNPSLTQSIRRNQRWYRVIINFFFFIFLLISAYTMYYQVYLKSSYGYRYYSWIYQNQQYGKLKYFYENMLLHENSVFLLGLIFLLLRYNLKLNDHSHHIKSLNHTQLQQLLLTNLDQNGLFLHHFLYFCLRYRILVIYILFCSLHFLVLFFSTSFYWLMPKYYDQLADGLFIILLTWIAGAFQYVIEWYIYAGKPKKFYYSILSIFISIIIGLNILVLIQGLLFLSNRMESAVYGNDSFTLFYLFRAISFRIIVLSLLCGVVLLLGRVVYANTMKILWNRFYKKEDRGAKYLDKPKLANLDSE